MMTSRACLHATPSLPQYEPHRGGVPLEAEEARPGPEVEVLQGVRRVDHDARLLTEDLGPAPETQVVVQDLPRCRGAS